MVNTFIDDDLKKILEKRIASLSTKYITVGTGITSSHLGDERNLREFIIADEIVKYLRAQGYNTLFLLVDDSFDALNFRQLRVAVNKDEKLIKKFEKYCGMPIRLIPDPYECHVNHSAHFQNEILNRLNSLDINVNIIDSYASYETGLYDFAKEIVFTRMGEIKEFLKKRFPTYKMKKIYWPLCSKCHRLETTDIKSIKGEKVEIICSSCESNSIVPWKKIKGKFGWKIDTAIKWNVFKFSFEPFSTAYLDPDMGSYTIAKSLSEEFFGGNSPAIIEYGQILMERKLSYTLLVSLPKNVFRKLFLQKRKRDITLTEGKIIQVTKECSIDEKNSFYDYVTMRLPYEILEGLSHNHVDRHARDLLLHGSVFAKQFLKRDVLPKLPQENFLKSMDSQAVHKTQQIFNWIVDHKIECPNEQYDLFAKSLNKFLMENKIGKAISFPFIRKLLSQEEGIPLSRVFFFLSLQSLYAYLFIIERHNKK